MKAADKKHAVIEFKHDLITQEVAKVVNKLVQEVANSEALKKSTDKGISTSKITRWKQNLISRISLAEREGQLLREAILGD